MSDKQRKIFKIIVIVLVVLLVGELIYFGVKYTISRKNSVFYTVVNNAIFEDENNYVGAGFSDFKNSKFNDYNDGITKATLYEYKDGKEVKEVELSTGYNSSYSDILKIDDGYIAIGTIQMTKDQKKENLAEGLIVKYDKNFKVVWRKNVSILGKTELLKIKQDGEDFIIVGSSIYGEGYVGNHTTGGAIILKYDKDGKQLSKANYGGPYSGKFNDVLVEDDGYVAVGLGKANSGIIIKYDKDLKEKWNGSYGYTDKNGITAVKKLKDNYITTSTKVVNPKDTNSYSASLVLFDDEGNKIDNTKFTMNKITYFTDLEVTKDDDIIVTGTTGKNIENSFFGDAVIVKYDKDLVENSSKTLKGNKNDLYTRITLIKDNVIAFGYSNSKIKEYKYLNGYDYFPITKKYDLDLK